MKDKRKRALSDLRYVAKSVEGRRLLWQIMSESGIFLSSFNKESNIAAFQEGRRSVGLNVLHSIFDAKASLFGQMQEEHASEFKREEIEIKQEDEDSDPFSLSKKKR